MHSALGALLAGAGNGERGPCSTSSGKPRGRKTGWHAEVTGIGRPPRPGAGEPRGGADACVVARTGNEWCGPRAAGPSLPGLRSPGMRGARALLAAKSAG